MKLGFVSAILSDMDFKGIVEFASRNGFSSIEVMCWPKGKIERKYAGVTHIDMETLTPEAMDDIKMTLKENSVEIASLGYYPNPMDPEKERQSVFLSHIHKLIDSAKLMGIDTVGTFIGRDKSKTIEENLKVFPAVWTPIIQYAEEREIRIAIENCPMLFTNDEWPGGLNLATTPEIWEEMFSLIPSPYFGLNYDPSHFIWQKMEYIAPIREFADRIFQIHFKDIKVWREKLDRVGIMATPLKYMSPVIPGRGDVDWKAFINALQDIGYNGHACIEVEDADFEGSLSSRQESLIRSRDYLKQLGNNAFGPNL